VQAAFFAPNPRTVDGLPAAGPPAAPAARAAAPARANGKAAASGKSRKSAPKPRLYYRWKDDQGVLHVGQTPPPDGTSFTLIRAFD
jgi:hypothetical protein